MFITPPNLYLEIIQKWSDAILRFDEYESGGTSSGHKQPLPLHKQAQNYNQCTCSDDQDVCLAHCSHNSPQDLFSHGSAQLVEELRTHSCNRLLDLFFWNVWQKLLYLSLTLIKEHSVCQGDRNARNLRTCNESDGRRDDLRFNDGLRD